MIHTTRNTFGALFQSVFKTGIGAEVGVQQGDADKNRAKILSYMKTKHPMQVATSH